MALLMDRQPWPTAVTLFASASLASALFAICTEVAAQAPQSGQYPTRPVRVVIPFAPGGTPDTQMRIVAERLTPRLGQQLVYDYRPGAAGSIGMEVTARAIADGYTIVAGTVGAWAVTPHLQKLTFDPLTDLVPIVMVATAPAVLVVHPSLPVHSVKELIAIARQRPGMLNYGSTGIGGGIAIPHGRLASMVKPLGLFARMANPVDFDAIDERPVDIVFLLVTPEGAGADHLKALARVSRLLRDRSLVEKLRATDNAEALYALLVETVQAQSAA